MVKSIPNEFTDSPAGQNMEIAHCLLPQLQKHRAQARVLAKLRCQLSVNKPNPPPLSARRSRTAVLVPANLSCHPPAIVIHVFTRLCAGRDKTEGGWWWGDGGGGSQRWKDMKKRLKLESGGR